MRVCTACQGKACLQPIHCTSMFLQHYWPQSTLCVMTSVETAHESDSVSASINFVNYCCRWYNTKADCGPCYCAQAHENLQTWHSWGHKLSQHSSCTLTCASSSSSSEDSSSPEDDETVSAKGFAAATVCTHTQSLSTDMVCWYQLQRLMTWYASKLQRLMLSH